MRRRSHVGFFALIFALSGIIIPLTNEAEAHTRHHHVSKHHPAAKTVRHSSSVSLMGVTPVLANKARQIAADCGSVVISAVSRRGNRSNHPIGRAVDMRGNPGCIYAHLKGWAGGYSTDYSAAGHIHISYNPGGQEWGLRFAHGGHGSRRRGPAAIPQYAMQPSAFAQHGVN